MKRLALAMTLLPFAAMAECPPGLAGQPNCVPPNHPASPFANDGAKVAGEVWQDRWGAIFVDRGVNRAGISAGESSRRDAIRTAQASCRENGGVKCKEWTIYRNGCVAAFSGIDFSVAASGATMDRALKIGEEKCAKAEVQCTVTYQACSLPERVR